MTMQRRRIRWSGFIGGPGVTTLYAQSGAVLNTPLRAFFQAITPFLPVPTTIHIDASGDELDPATGALTGTWTDTVVADTTGATSGAYAAPAGLIVEWNTNGLGAHRRVRGKTYLVPSNQITTTGQPQASAITAIQAAANTLVAAAAAPNNLYVWHRPTPGGSNGAAYPIVSAFVPNKVVVLRSRRD